MPKLKPSTLREFKITLLRLDLNQTTLARRLQVSPRWIRHMLAGKYPAHETWRRLRDEFGFPIEALPQFDSPRSRAGRSIKNSAKVSKVSNA
jgi:hypothetical protein